MPWMRIVLADRIDTLEQLVGDVGADDATGARSRDVDVGQRLARTEAVVLHDLVRRGDAEDQARRRASGCRQTTSAMRRRPARLQATATASGIAARTASRVAWVIFGRAAMRGPSASSISPSWIGERRTWNAFVPIIAPARFSLDVRVHPLDDRDDRDEERHGHDDAEQREERAELVGADLRRARGETSVEAHYAESCRRTKSITSAWIVGDSPARRNEPGRRHRAGDPPHRPTSPYSPTRSAAPTGSSRAARNAGTIRTRCR